MGFLFPTPKKKKNQADKKGKKTAKKIRTVKWWKSVSQDGGKVPEFPGPWMLYKETNIFRKWLHLLTFAKWFWWLTFQLSFCSKQRRGVRKKQFSQWEYKILSLMKCFLWFRDNNALLGFMLDIDSLCIFYRSLDEIQLIVFYKTERLSFLIFSNPPHSWLFIPFPCSLSIV